jgi:hypothetical protein
VDDPFLGFDDFNLRLELGIVANHGQHRLEDFPGLIPIRRRQIDFPLFRVEEQAVRRNRRGQLRLPLLAGHHEQARPVVPNPVRIRREQRPDDVPFLPFPQIEGLPGKISGMGQPADHRHRAIGAGVALHGIPAHLLTGASAFFGTAIRARLAGVNPKYS